MQDIISLKILDNARPTFFNNYDLGAIYRREK